MSSRPRPFEKFYINIPFRFLAHFIAKKLQHTFVTPNLVAITGIAIVGIGCCLLSFLPVENAWISVPFILSMALFAALDGTLARYKKISNSFGSWLNVIAERIEYILIGVSFSWYSYTVTQDYLILFLCLTSLIFREGIGTTSVMTLAKMPKGWYGIYNEDFLYKNNSLLKIGVRSFFYTGTHYILFVCLGILFRAPFYFILFMSLYGLITYIAVIIQIGIKVYNEG